MRQAIWGPIKSGGLDSIHKRFGRVDCEDTKVFDVDGALFPQSSSLELDIFAIGHKSAITAFGDTESVLGRPCFRSQ